MNRAFIFDFDGVLINNEGTWEERKRQTHTDLFGEKIHSQMGSTIGINMDGIYNRAISLGATTSKEALEAEFYRHAHSVYREAPLTPGIDQIGKTLTELGYKIGIVSASPREWIDAGLVRTELKNYVTDIISLHDRPDLHHKPAPDGYQAMMKTLGSSPETTIILEDSNAGIESGKSAGAFTIGFTQNLTEGYVQHGADTYAKTFSEVVSIINARAN
jgi:HAD superfamily hydrolase (TIGR01509 family)